MPGDDKTGETPRYTFRFSADAIAKLDELVEQFAAETGASTRTAVLVALILKEHGRRKKSTKSPPLS